MSFWPGADRQSEPRNRWGQQLAGEPVKARKALKLLTHLAIEMHLKKKKGHPLSVINYGNLGEAGDTQALAYVRILLKREMSQRKQAICVSQFPSEEHFLQACKCHASLYSPAHSEENRVWITCFQLSNYKGAFRKICIYIEGIILEEISLYYRKPY